MVVYDFVQGRRIAITFTPTLDPPGNGNVYVIDDVVAFEIGWTLGQPANRTRGLQTGNPRPFTCVALISGVTHQAEALLQRHFDALGLNLVGEWYRRADILVAADSHTDFAAYLGSLLPPGSHTIELREPIVR